MLMCQECAVALEILAQGLVTFNGGQLCVQVELDVDDTWIYRRSVCVFSILSP